MVSDLERGDRNLDLEELIAVGWALRAPFEELLRLRWKGDPLAEDYPIPLESGNTVPVNALREFLHAGREAFAQITRTLSQQLVAAGLAEETSSITIHPSAVVTHDEKES